MRNFINYGVWVILSMASVTLAQGQSYDDSSYRDSSNSYMETQQSYSGYPNQGVSNYQEQPNTYPSPNLQYDSRDAGANIAGTDGADLGT